MLVTWRLGAHRNGASIRQGLSSPKKQLLHRGLGKCYEGQGLETLNTFKKYHDIGHCWNRHRRTPNFSTIWQHIGVDQQNLNIGGYGRVFQLLLKTKNLSHHIAQWEGVADGRGRQSPSGCVFSGFCEPSRFLRNVARLARKPCTSSAACCATCN